MPRCLFFNVGVSSNNGHAGPLGTALGCTAAANAMAIIGAEVTHGRPNVLVDRDATLDGFLQAFRDVTCPLHPGDLAVVSLAGHGTNLDARSDDHNPDEPHDQAMVLWDDYLVDNDLHDACKEIEKRIDVVILADGCFTGTITTRSTRLPADGSAPSDAQRQSGYHDGSDARAGLTANILLISATSSTGVVSAGLNGGLPPFTRAVVDYWRDAENYLDLLTKIRQRVKSAGIDRSLLLDPTLLEKRPFRV